MVAMRERLRRRLRKRSCTRSLAALRASNLWASGQRVTWRTRRRLRKEARRGHALTCPAAACPSGEGMMTGSAADTATPPALMAVP